MDDTKPAAGDPAPAQPDTRPRNRAIFVTRAADPYSAGRVLIDPDGALAAMLCDACRPATREEIAIGGLSLEIPEA